MPEKRKGRLTERKKASTPAWMVTYSDMVTLLLTFFVLLLSMATIDIAKMKEVILSMGRSFGFMGIAPDTAESDINLGKASSPIEFPKIARHDISQELEEELKKSGLGEMVEVVENPEGIVLTIKDRVLFDLGRAEINPSARPIIRKIADLIKDTPYDIRVEGHTDNLPIHTFRYPSNWELSTNRAITVAKAILASTNIPASRIAAVGFGEYRPIAPNDTPANRQKNRRVSIVLVEKGSKRKRPGKYTYGDQYPLPAK